MFEMKVADAICSIADRIVPRDVCKRTFRGAFFHVDLNISSVDHKKNLRHDVRFIIAGNRSVWVHISKFGQYSLKPIPITEWKNTSNHDSCWRGDGVERPLSTLYFEVCDKVEKKARPIDLHQNCWFALGSDVWKDVEVTWEPEPNNSYKRKLVSYKFV